ncbi:ABC transporter permease [Mycoplasma crocodyli]|uniref:Spermidine/putrescine transport system permease PotB n=1 Tax=Mycoplasma crocodyli (strain ATCC 51981 / MP145) TaxID=512564 RepID=D5E563_MYCCM|nr:ABC transporter permease [Mycoplasma crocodyli]ADE19414.1 spermidine/putrescine transport system permease PotB [Mycoplasma crocodyli MP145]
MYSKIKEKVLNNKRLMLLIPYFVVALLLILLPIILIIINAFSPQKSEQGYSDNWELLKALSTWNIISRSLRVGIISAILCLVLGFPYAYFVSSSKSKIFQIYAMSLMLSPMAIFTIARVYSLRTLFVNIFDDNALNKEWFLIVGLTYLNLPLMIMPLYTVLKDMPGNIIEASHDLGNGSAKTMVKVIIPYALKAILSGFGMIFLSSATTFIISAKLLPDGSQNQMIGDIITKTINPGNKYDLSKGSSLVIVVSALFIGIYSLILLLPKLFFKFKKGANYE